MRIGVYVRVSTPNQVQNQTIEQQVDRMRLHLAEQGDELAAERIFRDDGYSGARLSRPGLDRLRDAIRAGELDRLLVTAPDRLARNYVHQMLLIEEFEHCGCPVEFLDRPMSHDPHDQLLLQIRGAVAEYERALITERMRRGRQAKLRAGILLPWPRPPYGYQVSSERSVHAIRRASPAIRWPPRWWRRSLRAMRSQALPCSRSPGPCMPAASARRPDAPGGACPACAGC